jgi:hypothetical protein
MCDHIPQCGWDDVLVAKETSNNADDNMCIWVSKSLVRVAPQPSAAGECMIDVPMVHMCGREVEKLREGGEYLHGH